MYTFNLHFFLRFSLFSSFFFVCLSPVFGAYLNRPELVDFNFAGANICEKTQLRIKFDHEGFNPGNVFTVEVAANGNFSGSNIITLVGSLSQSGNQQNVFLTVTFPATVPAGSNYRLRVRGSNPLTFSSQLNEHPFAISKLEPSDPNFYPTGYWRGYFYRWTPSTTATINDANTEDIFNPNNYLGYISEDSMSFDYNWGNNSNAPGTFADTNKVCGSYRDFYSIRMRRRFVFEEGYYLFGGGADDGFRLSLDGGATWLINDWNDHAYRGSMHNNGCGIFLTAGTRDMVVEFYENRTDARFRLIFVKTGNPAIDPISIVSPANGSTICSSAPPLPLVGNPAGAWQWSGPGVTNRGFLNPAIGGTGPRTITYQTGFSAFGQNCVKTASITVNVVPGLSAAFTGVDTAYCSTSGPLSLSPQNPGGNFSGPGVSGNQFSPGTAGPGLHRIRHILATPGGCNDTVDAFVRVQAPIIPLVILPDLLCANADPVPLSANVAGTFSGPGVVGGNSFDPAQANPGANAIVFTSVQGPCTQTASGSISVTAAPIATLSLSNPLFCPNAIRKEKVLFNPPGGILSGPGLLNDSVSNAGLAIGDYTLQYITGNAPAGCVDTAYATFSVNALPDAGFADLPDTVCEGSANLTLVPNTPGGTFTGQGVIPPNQFAPSLLLVNNTYQIEYRVSRLGCSNRSEQFVNILDKLKPQVTFPQLKAVYCQNEGAFAPVSSPPARYFLNNQEVTSINPGNLSPGQYALRAVYFPASPLECIDSSSAVFRFQVIANPKPELGPEREIESGESLQLDPGIPAPYVWTSDAAGFSSDPNQPLRFTPLTEQTVTVTASDPNRNCFGSDQVLVKVREKLVFPTFFTPHTKDNRNDAWEIKGAYPNMKVRIYNRWGKEVYQGTTQGERAWDGAETETGGIYYFIVEHPTDSSRQWTGWVQVAGAE